jgi:LPXTG-motif cell wall-anchored protein
MRTIVLANPRDGTSALLIRVMFGAGLFLLMVFAGVQVVRSDGAIRSMASSPATTAYHFSSHPMIAGTVVTVNDREMVVNTDQGERMTLSIDSATLAPRDLAPGMVMRAEFLALEDCRFYAQRIMPIRTGMSTNRLQAYTITQDSPEAMAHDGSSNQASVWSPPQTMGEHSQGMTMMATPTTADYHSSTRPMVSGRVVSVNDHRLVVKTEQGQMVGLVMDSHTMVPGEVAPDAFVRAEFRQMKDGRYYANRVRTVVHGVAGREQAYAQTRDSDLMMAQNLSDCRFPSAGSGNTVTSALEPREMAASPAVAEQSVTQPVVERPETLPQTASNQPLLLLLGLSALGSAGLITIVRGSRLA